MRWTGVLLACVMLLAGARAGSTLPLPESCTAVQDLVVVIDSQNTANAMQFTIQFLQTFKISPSTVRVAIVHNDRVVLSLSMGVSMSAVHAVDLVNQGGMLTTTDKVLDAAQKHLATNGRMNVPHVMVVLISPGRLEHTSEGELQTVTQQIKADGIKTFVVADNRWISGKTYLRLKMIGSSNPTMHVLKTDDFVGDIALAAIADLATHACQSTAPCQCSSIKGEQFLTCDEAMIRFSGNCTYTMAESLSEPGVEYFKVSLDMSLSRVKMTVFDKEFVMFRNGQKCDVLDPEGKTESMPIRFTPDNATNDESLDCYQGPSGDCHCCTEYDLRITLMSKNNIRVTIPKKFRNLLTGLCGQYDGNVTSDYVTAEGVSHAHTFENDQPAEEKYIAYDAIGTSWAEGAASGECGSSLTVPSCTTDIMSYAFQTDYCGSITDEGGPFARCVSTYPNLAKTFMEACIESVCSCPAHESPKSRACPVVEAFAEQCKAYASTYVVREWRELVKCPMACGARQEYTTYMSACAPTCANPYAEFYCSEPSTEGCKCEPGFVMEDGECVSHSQCGCIDNYGVYHKLGHNWFSPGCRYKYRCGITEEGRRQICEEMFYCPDSSVCTTHNGYYGCWHFGPCIRW